MTRWFLTLELIDTPLRWMIWVAVGIAALLVVVARPLHPVRLLVSGVVGAVLGYLLAHGLEAIDAFDGPLPVHAATWAGVAIGIAVAGAVGALSRPWWRRVLALVMAVCAVIGGGLEVNAAFGVTHTMADILGVQTLGSEELPAATAAADGDPATLFERWQAPADMPAKGRVSALSGSQRIPDTGFAARDAALYLPPAALVRDPPRLPLIVFMMGEPGTPDPTAIATALDDFAAAHQGLAPIAIVADQLGAMDHDPVCQDSQTYGAVSTYVNTDVRAFASAHLNVIDDPAYWVIGGYSNGGACAFTWGAQYPDLWGSVLDVSGNEYPGSEHPDAAIADVFDGDASAFEAAKPLSQLAAHPGAYAGHVAVFTHGDQDTKFGPGQVSNAAAAQSAGFTVFGETVAGAGHTGPALDTGLALAIADVAPHLGLAAASG